MQKSQKNLIWAKENTRSSRIPQLPNMGVHIISLCRISLPVNQLKQRAAFTAIWIILFNITPEQTVAKLDWKKKKPKPNNKQQTQATASLTRNSPFDRSCENLNRTGGGSTRAVTPHIAQEGTVGTFPSVMCRFCGTSPQGWLRLHVP